MGHLVKPDDEALWVAKTLSGQTGATRRVRFKQLRSSYSDDAGLQDEAVRLCWRLARAVAPLVALSVHPYSEHREHGRYCDNSHTREQVGRRCRSFSGMIWSNISRRQLPIQHSAMPFARVPGCLCASVVNRLR